MEKQGFKTIDLGVMLSLSIVAFGVIMALAGRDDRDPLRDKALVEAQNLALQLAAGGLGTLSSESQDTAQRAPASHQNPFTYEKSIELFGKHGKIGIDPWGNPFRFNFINVENSNEGQAKVVVWSDGHNGQPETSMESLQNIVETHKNVGRDLRLGGDDFGYLRPVAKD